MRVSNPTYARKHSVDAGRFHIFVGTDGLGVRFMRCGTVYNPSSALEVRFDFGPDQIREQVCGLCLIRGSSS